MSWKQGIKSFKGYKRDSIKEYNSSYPLNRKKLIKRVLYTILISLLFTPTFAMLPRYITKMIAKDKINPSRLSIYITPTNSSLIIAKHQIDKSRIPASVIKLTTTYSALLELGPSWKWPTDILYTGTIKDGTITGDIIIKPYGDPTLSCKDLLSIINRMKDMGIEHIKGDLIIDRSFFSVDKRINSGFDKYIHSEYNAMPDALMFDDHLCHITIDTRSGFAEVHKKFPDKSFEVINNLKVTNDKSCRGRYSWPRILIDDKNTTPPKVFLEGTLSTHCSPRRISKVLTYPYKSFIYAFLDALKVNNISFDGEARLAKTPKDAKDMMVHYSSTLQEIIAKTNKKSNNLYARHIFLLLGAKLFGAPANLFKSRKAVYKILGERDILGKETILDNGCGLSHKTRTTARTIHNLLEDAHKKYAWIWMNALAIAGVDGTVKRRFKHSVVKGKAWVKTGTLKRAKNIAGYVKGKSGRLYTVVIFYNGAEHWKGRLLEDQILEWIARKK